MQVEDEASVEEQLIIVASPDPWVQEHAQSTLHEAGFRVEVAANGEDALARLTTGRPALVVMDSALPGVHFRVLAATIRAAFGDEVPMIMLGTADTVAEVAREVGANGYVSEPIQESLLLSAVRAAIRTP
jgi:two-component system response regulator MprA